MHLQSNSQCISWNAKNIYGEEWGTIQVKLVFIQFYLSKIKLENNLTG